MVSSKAQPQQASMVLPFPQQRSNSTVTASGSTLDTAALLEGIRAVAGVDASAPRRSVLEIIDDALQLERSYDQWNKPQNKYSPSKDHHVAAKQ